MRSAVNGTSARRVFLGGTFLSASGGSRSPIEDLADRLENEGWGVVRSSEIRNGALRGIDLIVSLLAHHRDLDAAVIDVFSGRAFLWAEAAGILLRAMNVPFVYSLHGGALPEFSASRLPRVRRALRRANAVTAPSRYLVEKMRPSAPDIILLPNALDLSGYRFAVRRPARARLVWVRRFHRIYHPELAVEVVARLVREIPDVELTMVGRDSGDGSWERTRERARQLGVAERIRFAGSVSRSEVANFLDRADVFLNTSTIDNTPVSVLEAMASGLAVVTTGVGGIRYLLEAGVNALLVPAGDSAAMAAAVADIVRDAGLAEKLSENGRKLVETFDWPHVLSGWKHLLTTVTREGPVRGSALAAAGRGEQA